ncbi:MAG: hypothetical protein AAGA56_15275 [Myxococcota bacterium]
MFDPPSWSKQYVGQPHNNLLTGICRDFGMTLDRFGTEQSVVGGPDEGRATTVDLTGVFSELYG